MTINRHDARPPHAQKEKPPAETEGNKGGNNQPAHHTTDPLIGWHALAAGIKPGQKKRSRGKRGGK